MPTGYTTIIHDNPGVSFEDFALRCARAFGALVMLRDQPLDAALPEELAVNPYYVERVTRARADLSVYQSLTLGEAGDCLRAENKRIAAENAKNERMAANFSTAHARLWSKVCAWVPPKECQGLQAFMLEQLEIDEPAPPYLRPTFEGTAEQWLLEKISFARKELARAEIVLAEEVERTRQRNEWLSALRESLRKESGR